MSPVASQDPAKQAIWEIESTNPDLVPAVEAALREVVDPEIGLNVIELGLVRNVALQDNQGKVTMIMTTPFCPYAPALLEMTRKKAADALQRDTTIMMGTELWDLTYMEEGAGADWGIF
ncbi:MAG: iron-sulfur cluster assembly protein [Anaerolineales bacterium]|nr:MAG: iron-sulfur cluster assembly protein [Anaerolineales bacterium]